MRKIEYTITAKITVDIEWQDEYVDLIDRIRDYGEIVDIQAAMVPPEELVNAVSDE